MELTTVRLEIPENGNLILGQTHFIKSTEDLYEALVNAVPHMKFGIAFGIGKQTAVLFEAHQSPADA